MEKSWCLIGNDDDSTIESLNTSQLSETNTLDQDENLLLCESQRDQNKIDEQIKDLHDIDELKMNEVLDLITNKNNNRLKNIVQVSSDKKSLLQKSATNSSFTSTPEQNTNFPLSKSQGNTIGSIIADNKINDMLSTLSKKQENFITNAKQTDPPKTLTENIKEANRVKNSETMAAAIDETSYVKHEQPRMSVNELLRANQSDAQLLVSTMKEKNKNLLNAIFDY